MKGRIIVLEGIDGCGKNTQIEMLKAKVEGLAVFKYPTQGYALLNDYLEKKISLDPKALFLLFLSDIANEQKKVKEAVDSGRIVVLDRYVFSTIAYETDGLPYDGGKKIVEDCGFLRPDMALLLDISAEVSQERKSAQKELDRYEEDRDYLEKVRGNFLRLHEERFLTPNWHMLDAGREADAVHRDIMRLLGAK